MTERYAVRMRKAVHVFCAGHFMARACMGWLSAPDRVDALQSRFQQLHLTLQRDTAQISTHALEKILSR